MYKKWKRVFHFFAFIKGEQILCKPNFKFNDVEGLIQMEKTPSSKPVIIHVGAKDVAQTEKTWERFQTMLKYIKQSHEKSMSLPSCPIRTLEDLNYRLVTFWKAQ